MKTSTLIFVAALFVSGVSAQNFTASYSFDSVKTTTGKIDPTPIVSPAGVTFGPFCSTGVSANPNAGSRFSFTGWTTGALNGATSYGSLTGAVDTSRYFSVSLCPASGYDIDLKTISFNVQRSGTGIRTYVVRSSADGYKTSLNASVVPADTNLSVMAGHVFFINKDVTTSLPGSTITLASSVFTGRSSAVTFRFYGYNAESAAGTFSLDNVLIAGQTSLATAAERSPSAVTDFIVFPNPSSTGTFQIDMGSAGHKTTLTIYNLLGQVIHSSSISGTGRHTIDLPDAPNGRYILNLKNETENVTRIIMINK
jgi:hypothetical protein